MNGEAWQALDHARKGEPDFLPTQEEKNDRLLEYAGVYESTDPVWKGPSDLSPWPNRTVQCWVQKDTMEVVYEYPNFYDPDWGVAYWMKWIAPRLCVIEMTFIDALFWSVRVANPDFPKGGKALVEYNLAEALADATYKMLERLKDDTHRG